MDTVYQETKNLLRKYNLSAEKRLGQNFLIDASVLQHIVDVSAIHPQDFVIEIGPGLGTLTQYLLEKAGKVLAIELDDRMLPVLQDRFSQYPHFSLLHADILQVDLATKILEEQQKGNISHVKIVANLPYYITTPIVMKLLEDRLPIESITIMVQKEVAKRLTVLPGSKYCGAITYSVYYYAEPREVLTVPATSFLPAPEVDSAVVQLRIRPTPLVHPQDTALFFQLIKTGFLQRRKTLCNAFGNSLLFSNKEEIKSMFHSLGIPENARAEEISIEAFAIMADYITKKRQDV